MEDNKHKRFLLFLFDGDYPSGGMGDCVASFDSIEEIKSVVIYKPKTPGVSLLHTEGSDRFCYEGIDRRHFEFMEVFDCEERVCVEVFNPPPPPQQA
jgi:hypothetical protein